MTKSMSEFEQLSSQLLQDIDILIEKSIQVDNGHRSEKGGLKMMPFVLANELSEKVAGYSVNANIILYLTKEYHFSHTDGVSVLFLWTALSNFMPVVGAFLSDSYLGRFHVIAAASLVNLIGSIMLWLTTVLRASIMVISMSALWIVPQYCLSGLTEAFYAIAQIEFLYAEFPKWMASMAMSLVTLGVALGSLVGSLMVGIIKDLSSRGGKQNWLSDNINRGHYDYYYWVIAGLGAANLLYYGVCRWFFWSRNDDRVRDEEDDGRQA